MKVYKIYGQDPTWKLIDIKYNIEDMYEYVCNNYEKNHTTYLIMEADYKDNSEFPICLIVDEREFLEFKEEYKPKNKIYNKK